ncbi:phd-finger domain-containing protein [Gigaspora margarita]|uniref:Phd-finger domain-containing protein n=1 Tax=Gigaspora margarita TaxID=4874 RepID=A0A8H4AT86_GIGMA|nr:phd-finger domain-containing protein [Gigaspora margarita]
MDRFCSEILRRSVHQALASAGFEKSSKLGGEVLADVLKDYLLCLGKSAHEGAINSGRTKTTPTDVLAAFEDFGIKIDELKEWSQTDGKILGKYTGPLPQPKIMEGLLRSGLPGYSTNEFRDLPTIENKDTYNLPNVKPVDPNEMQVDTVYIESHEKISNEIIGNSNEREGIKELKIEATNEHSVDSNNVILQSDVQLLRPSYVPEWLPPFPEIKPQETEKIEDKADDTSTISPEINSNQAMLQDTKLKIHKDDDVNSMKSNLLSSQDKSSKMTRRKRSPDQRPPTYDIANVYNSITPPKVQTQEESSFEPPKKKRKLKITPSSLISFHAIDEISHDGITNQGVTGLTKLMSSTVGPLKLLKEGQTKKPPSITTRIRSDHEIPVTNVSSLSEVNPSQVKLPVSRKGKEKMVDSSDFQETVSLNSSRPKPPTAIRRGSKVKLGKSITKSTPVPDDKPAPTTTGATKLRIRLGKVSPIDVAPAASPVASTSSVQTQPVNNPSNVGVADPPEVINCICPYPFSEIDDGNFMLSCDGCQVWFHGICTGFGPSYVEVDTWYCERCRARGMDIS